MSGRTNLLASLGDFGVKENNGVRVKDLFLRTHLLSLEVMDQMLPKPPEMGFGMTVLMQSILTITLAKWQKEWLKLRDWHFCIRPGGQVTFKCLEVIEELQVWFAFCSEQSLKYSQCRMPKEENSGSAPLLTDYLPWQWMGRCLFSSWQWFFHNNSKHLSIT